MELRFGYTRIQWHTLSKLNCGVKSDRIWSVYIKLKCVYKSDIGSYCGSPQTGRLWIGRWKPGFGGLSSILTWHRGYRDPLGGSPSTRPFHCTSVGLTGCISPVKCKGSSGPSAIFVRGELRVALPLWTRSLVPRFFFRSLAPNPRASSLLRLFIFLYDFRESSGRAAVSARQSSPAHRRSPELTTSRRRNFV